MSVVDAHPGTLNKQAAAVRLGLTKGTVSRQIEKAVDAGLMTATESPHSRREKVLALTPEGSQVVRTGDSLLDQTLVEQMPDLSRDALRTTIETLSTLNAALGGSAPPDPV
ncbi:MarR family winged helix-turn-helix transcriptional regulator [Paramicrobacterium chengjingii]|uniref:MarR family winged helix-turn-helix transcriptional regulator n=1 Tax=Paramicrobacterium chengjingii TaxID=2769067 RepID=UPI002467B674|nr:MarR family winged helix-turn-helix transcriptional regulator [Microbacterium chengjingii]